LEPQLGVVKIDETDFVLADLPGLIEGAHEGVGLGDRFLGHAERCASILHLIDGTGDNIAKTYKTIRAELEAYGHGLDEKPEIVALNKVDAIREQDLAKKRTALEKACGHKVHVISGVSGEGINTVLRAMAREISRRRAVRAEEAQYGRPAPVPRTRSERQTVNFKAPVVPQPKLVTPQAVSPPTPAKKPMRGAKAGLRLAKAKAAKAKLAEAKEKPKAKAAQSRLKPAGRAKAKPKAMSKTAQRTQKKQRR
jgi:Fe2+ transport system protein B